MPTTHAALQQQHAEAAAQLEELRAKLHQQQQELLEARCQCSALAAANRALQEEVEEMHVRCVDAGVGGGGDVCEVGGGMCVVCGCVYVWGGGGACEVCVGGWMWGWIG